MYKHLLLVIGLALLPMWAIGQGIMEDVSARSNYTDVEDRNTGFRSDPGISTTIHDTLEFTLLRRTSVRGIFLNSVSSANAMAQYYESPVPVLVRGFDFYAYQSDLNTTAPVSINCYIYQAANKLPTGSPLAQVVVSVPQSTNTSLPATRRSAVFSNPVEINGPFVLVVENTTGVNVTISSSNWETQDGKGDFFGSAKIGTVWYSGASIQVGGLPFDADFFLAPMVSYDLVTGFETDRRCLFGNDTVTFTNISSPLVESRFFNRAVFLGKKGRELYNWNFHFGAGMQQLVDTAMVYIIPQKYRIDMQTEFFTWRKVINPLYRDSIDVPPVAQFSIQQNANSITLNNQSTGIDKVHWDLGDSSFTNLLNPVYYYFKSGTYTVTLVVTNGCSSDTTTQQVTIQVTGLREQLWPEAVSVYPVPARDVLHINFSGRAVERIQLHSLQGQLLTDVATKGNQALLPISHLPAGPMVLRIIEDGQMYHRVLMKQ